MVSTVSGWEEKYIVEVGSGYVVALPYMAVERKDTIQQLLNVVASRNIDKKPVVLMSHTTVSDADVTGHGFEKGTIRTLDLSEMGIGYDYLALGHIHKPQTLGHFDDVMKSEVCYDAPVARYSGSALHVSCDEAYPHSVSLVDIDHHGGKVIIKQLRIDELFHFYVLPESGGSFKSAEEAIASIGEFCNSKERGYIRLRIGYGTVLPSNFQQMVYDEITLKQKDVRYNPKIIWSGEPQVDERVSRKPTFEVAELQQMTNPMNFLERIIDQLPGFDIEELREAFVEVEQELEVMREENASKVNKKTKATTNK
jgi:exonuclease SbcD